MVQKKFPIIPIVVVAVGLMGMVIINMKSHPKDPSPLVSTTQNAPPPPASNNAAASNTVAKAIGDQTASKVPTKMEAGGPNMHLPFADGGMVVTNMPKYKPTITDSSINSGWYTSNAPQSYAKPAKK